MTAGDHYDEEILIELAEDGANQDTHPHLAECGECREAVGQYRSMLASFADESMWAAHPLDETPNPQTIANLRGYVEQMHREDAEAEPLVAELLAGPREEWMPRLMSDAKYRTAGVVRKLIAAMPTAVRATPRDAQIIAGLAVMIAEDLSETDYPIQPLYLLRGAAWRERGFSAYYVGEHKSGAQAAVESARLLCRSRVADHEFARLKVLNALLCRENDQLSRGLTLLEEAIGFFRASGQTQRSISALIQKTTLLSRIGDFVSAAGITESLLADEALLTDIQRATLHANLGYYYSELGNVVRALEEFDIASFMLDALDMKGDAVRNRWNAALIFERAGKLDDALRRLSEVTAAFESLGMNGSATLAALNAAQIHIAREEYCAVEKICERALDQFRSTGLGSSSRALTAIGLLHEASKRRHVPPTLLHTVVNFVRDLPDTNRAELTIPA